jgi:hypothetical protein
MIFWRSFRASYRAEPQRPQAPFTECSREAVPDVALVSEAYGWPGDLSDDQILQRLDALNAERAEEEKRGIIRWLRPEFQNPGGAATTQQSLGLPVAPAVSKSKPAKKPAWPKDLVGQVSSVRALLASAPTPTKPAEVAASFKGARSEKVADLLAALEALGQARKLDGDRFAA